MLTYVNIQNIFGVENATSSRIESYQNFLERWIGGFQSIKCKLYCALLNCITPTFLSCLFIDFNNIPLLNTPFIYIFQIFFQLFYVFLHQSDAILPALYSYVREADPFPKGYM
jgi:hypothetical protein